MCHKIESEQKINYIKIDDYIVGMKAFFVYGNKLVSRFLHFEYDFKISNEENFLITIEDDPKEQGIEFQIPINRYNVITVNGKIEGGMHILPIIDSNGDLYNSDLYRGNDLYIAVAFHPNDILMFDGRDISVKKFHILNENGIDKLLLKSGDKISLKKRIKFLRENLGIKDV